MEASDAQQRTNKKCLRRSKSALDDGRSERVSLAERRLRVQQKAELQQQSTADHKKRKTFRRSKSWDPRGVSEEALVAMGTTHQPEVTKRRHGSGTKFYHVADHSGDKEHFKTSYSFWTSKPALAMFCFLALAIKYKNTRFLSGAALVFLYEAMVVLGTWKRFIANHPIVQEFSEFTLEWFQYSLRQVERFCDRKDRSRKAVVGLCNYYYPVTAEYVGDYLRERRAEVADIACAEAERMRARLCDRTA